MPSRGPLTASELYEVLRSALDEGYLRAIEARGYGGGLEAFEMVCEQLARVARAIDHTTQALYILPWSGQSDQPASGARRSRLNLVVERSARHEAALLLSRDIRVAEVESDFGPTGPRDVETGREYSLRAPLVFLPGEQGPKEVAVEATVPGFASGLVREGAVRRLVQTGVGSSNTGASVVQSGGISQLVMRRAADVLGHEHVGQYIELTSGANAGQIRRIGGYSPPGSNDGGSLLLAPEAVFRTVGTAPIGGFQPGEQVVQYDTSLAPPQVSAAGTVLGATAVADGPPWYLFVARTDGEFSPTGGTIGPATGLLSGASFAIEDVTQSPALVPEVGTAAWRLLGWEADLGLSAYNSGKQSPGALATLDALGEERGVRRSPGETDESYRKRVASLADVVSPAALLRVANRILAAYGIQAVLREVGSVDFPGLYYDAAVVRGFAYDMDGMRFTGTQVGTFFEGEVVVQGTVPQPLVRGRASVDPAGGLVGVSRLDRAMVAGVPIVGQVSGGVFNPTVVAGGPAAHDRFRVVLDYERFRAYFEVQIPSTGLGESGICYDDHPANPYDSAVSNGFDGSPATEQAILISVWNALNQARAGGVGFDIVR